MRGDGVIVGLAERSARGFEVKDAPKPVAPPPAGSSLIIPNDANELYQTCALPPVEEVQPAGEMHERGSGREIITIRLRSTQLGTSIFLQ